MGLDAVEWADRIILGVDPGTSVTGYGIIACKGNKMKLVTYGVINLIKYKEDHFLRLRKIFERLLSLIEEFNPDELAVEAPFFGKNVQSMLKLGRAQGVAIAAALYRDLPITEYAPKKVKVAITGSGNASKEQVCSMLERLLNFRHEEKLLDGTDGLGVAVCHFLQKGKTLPGKGNGGTWSQFIKNNPGRINE